MPLPATVRPADGQLTIDTTFKAALSGAPDSRLDAAIGRFMTQLSRQTGIPMLGFKDAAPKLRVECAAPGNDYPTLGENEAYTLDVTPDGRDSQGRPPATARCMGSPPSRNSSPSATTALQSPPSTSRISRASRGAD